MSNPDPSLLQKAIDLMQSSGAEYAEARYHSLKRTTILMINGVVMGVEVSAQSGIATRAIVNGGLGFSSATRITSEDVRDAALRAVSAAKTSSRGVRHGVQMGPGRLGNARYSVLERRKLEDTPLDSKISYLSEIYKVLELEKNGFKVSNTTVIYSETIEEKILLTSDGAFIESRVPRVAVMYNLAATYEDKRANRFGEVGASGGYELLDSFNLQKRISDDIESLYTALVKARSPPRGRMDVVLSPEIVGLMVHESAGHPSEADRVLGREAAQAGMSFRTTYKEDRIGSDAVTVVDDPTIPGSFGFYLYDDEGVAARERILYNHGMLAELLHNRETAAVYGVESNGAARAMDYKSEPIVRMANTYMKPGTYSFEELIEDIKQGIYMKKYMEWNIDDIRWGQRYVALEAYVIENGEIKDPVTNVALEVTTKQLYSSIDAVGKDLVFYAGLCGKGEPPQGVPVWMGGPHVRLRGVTIQ
ncbi:TldD/PmbA family protein [Pyrofollis japonicus]|uniref:TldD/PmbA family protein n=1 Tax=Pyrofollis japonicus TaxID=3060460 RepID=UPI00295ADE59|nr:TldD/PmbA family protein [Pyrofollis japonicus]BEP18549.1 TldD/PmbA family protein [Pyrofollis japonicus]